MAQQRAGRASRKQAIDRYRRRAGMGRFDEEVWCSLYEIAKLQEAQNGPWPQVLEAYLQATDSCCPILC